MASITLDAPLTLNPTATTKLKLKNTSIDHINKTITIVAQFVDGADPTLVLEERQVEINNSGPVDTWISAREDQIIAYLLNKLGITGTKDI